MTEENPLLVPEPGGPDVEPKDLRLHEQKKLRGLRDRRWKVARGFDRKARTMRNPPPDDEQRNWFTEEFYDLLTVTNISATGFESEQDFENKQKIFRACVSRLNDKLMGAEARINALDIVSSLLMSSRSHEMLSNLEDELFDGVVAAFGKANSSEDELFRALRVLGLLSLHAGLKRDDFVRKLLDHIGLIPGRYRTAEQVKVNYQQPPPLGYRPGPYSDESVRCQALATIALATFFCADDELLILRALDIVEEVLCRHSHITGVTEDGPHGMDENTAVVTEPIRGAAADSWCLIATRLDPPVVFSRVQTKVLHAFRNLLFSDNLETRIAGGEAISFLFELAQDTAEDDESPEIWLAPDGDIWEDIIDQMNFLMNEYDRRMSRLGRREQHKMFRAFFKTVTEGQFPLEVLKMPECQMTVESWSGVKILDMLRHFMGAGFHEGLYHFPSVQEVLAMPDWMRKVVERTRTIEDEQAERRTAPKQNYWIDDGSSLPKARASRKYQGMHRGSKHRTSMADEMFPREYDVPQLPSGRNV